MGSTTTFDTETCPTTQEAILGIGRYNMRLLADKFKLLADADSKKAFLAMSTEQQAQAILAAKLDFDKAAKGGGKPSTAKAPLTRTPATGAKAATKAAPAEKQPSEDGGGASNAALLLEKLDEIIGVVSAHTESVENLRAEVAVIQGSVAGTNRLSMIAISLALQMSEQVLSAPAEGALETALEQLEGLKPRLYELLATAEAEEAEGEGEGNE